MFSFKLIYKVMLFAGLGVACVTAVLNYFFLPKLAEPRIHQVKELANTTSIIASELAIASFYENNPDRIIKAIKSSVRHINENEGFLQISIILYPNGYYYASTNEEFIGKKVGLSLLKKIEENESPNTEVEKLNYEFNAKTIPVLHFLRNISVKQEDGEEKRVAVVQILFDYSEILNKTRKTLLIAAVAFLACLFILTWILYLPFTRVSQKIVQGFNEIRKNNFNIKLKTKDFGEIGALFKAFNKMTEHLGGFYQERSQSKMNSVMDSIDGSSSNQKEFTLRKSEVTCLCARIPLVQDSIEEKSIEEFEENIVQFFEPFEIVIKEFGGQVIKALGNKVFVVFEGINSVDNAIRTALKVNQKWQMINHERKVLDRKKLDFGIGMHTANTVAGIVGHSSMNYTIIGESASIADYLCSCAKSEEILASSALMDKAGGSFQHQILSEINTAELDESIQILLLTNLQFSADDLQLKGVGSEGLNGSFTDGSGIMGSHNGAGSTEQESSIPGMLEETLSSAPLDSLLSDQPANTPTDETTDKLKENQAKKQSLWDEFEQK